MRKRKKSLTEEAISQISKGIPPKSKSLVFFCLSMAMVVLCGAVLCWYIFVQNPWGHSNNGSGTDWSDPDDGSGGGGGGSGGGGGDEGGSSGDDDADAFAYDCNVAYADADISVHFLELGNSSTGDCVYIKTRDCDILVDCGSTTASTKTVAKYLNNYVTDGCLEYVIVTHAHLDHYAGFTQSNYSETIFGRFSCDTIIRFAGTSAGKETQDTCVRFMSNLQTAVNNGATAYTALECVNESNGAQKNWVIGEGITLNILNSYYYAHPDQENENNNSVCFMITNHNQHYLFTGDLEATGEEYLVELNTLPRMELFKAAHHGSVTSNTSTLLSVIQPQVVCVCCCAWSNQYNNDNPQRKHPAQLFINNVAPYTDRLYVTTLFDSNAQGKHVSYNGNIMFMATATDWGVNCSNNNYILKSTSAFKKNRTWPTT